MSMEQSLRSLCSHNAAAIVLWVVAVALGGTQKPPDEQGEPLPITVKLKEVWFTGPNFTGANAVKMQDHYKDNNGNNVQDQGEEFGDTDINGPEWTDIDGDGVPEKSKHGLFKIGARFKVKAVFTIQNFSSQDGTVEAWAQCDDPFGFLNSEATPALLVQNGDSWEGVFESSEAPSSIAVYDDSANVQVDCDWRVLILDNQNSQRTRIYSAGSSHHTVFICKNCSYKPYDWVAWWSCTWAAGETQNKEIVDAIYDNLNNTGSTGPCHNLKYVYPDDNHPAGDSTCVLLKRSHGMCGDWAHFFADLCQVHGIQSVMRWSTAFMNPGQWQAVKNHPQIDADWKDYRKLAECMRSIDQLQPVGGGAINSRIFSDHAYCLYGSPYEVYDPSFLNMHKTNQDQLPAPTLEASLLWYRYWLYLFDPYYYPGPGHAADYKKCYARTVNPAHCQLKTQAAIGVQNDPADDYRIILTYGIMGQSNPQIRGISDALEGPKPLF